MITINVNPEELKDVAVGAELAKLYHKEIKAGRSRNFILQLLVIILGSEYFEEMTKEEKEAKEHTKQEKKERIAAWEKYLEGLGIEEWAKTINTPYHDLPKEIQALYPYEIPKYKESFDDFRMLGRVKRNSRQNEIFSARLVKYLWQNGYVTTDETGDHINYRRVAKDINEYLVQYDLPATKTCRAQYTRVSERGLRSYCTQLTTPKRSRFTGIAQALDIPEVYLAGYLKWKFNKDGSPVPVGKVA